MTGPLLVAEALVRRYPVGRGGLFTPAARVAAVDGVDFTVEPGVSLGIVGESGSGKSTLARLAMALERPDAGRILFRGEDLNALSASDLRRRRRHFQMVFQDPYGSLDPRLTVERIVAEPLTVAEPGFDRRARRERVLAILEAVGLPTAALHRYPHEFSGGQRQRVAIARALITEPALVVADEPVSALDVSVQAQVLNLLMDLKERRGLTYLFISHDLAVVEHVADRVMVMLRGRVVESGPAAVLFARPVHPYTRALVDALPDFDADPADHAAGAFRLGEPGAAEAGACPLADRCPRAKARCRAEMPMLRALADDRHVACFEPLG
ncbi:ABC transporter ATP-binding protein [Prosthecomicrobium hirschii]|uniref:ABC transporter ATP-binding protein n=1 Tax=Prosthecodimorpha hirschii TaxID=665126 RepID=UPI0009FB6892|nr:oligopeptide/dipeptide ABC transporter ATP-binding protein [Prosthecomicrobium hirschii]